jgi:hypothetical protein
VDQLAVVGVNDGHVTPEVDGIKLFFFVAIDDSAR